MVVDYNILSSFDKYGRELHRITHDDLLGGAKIFASNLLSPNQYDSTATICLLMPTCHELILALTSFLWFTPTGNQVKVAPLNPRYTLKELQFYVKDLRPSHFLVKKGFFKDDFVSSLKGLGPFSLIELDLESMIPWDQVIGSNKVPISQVDQRPSNCSFLFHTSGTTGKPKLAQLAATNINASLDNYLHTYPLEKGQNTLLVMPLFHVHGLFGSLFPSILARVNIHFDGEDMVTFKIHSSSDFIGDILQGKRITWLSAVPTILGKILQVANAKVEDISTINTKAKSIELPDLKWIRSCSSPLPPTLAKDLQRVFRVPILEAYAMTECSHMIASNRLDDYSFGSVGRACGKYATVSIRLLEIADDKVIQQSKSKIHCEPDKLGEVVVKGPNVMNSYAKIPDPKSSNEDYFAIDGDGYRWFRTGDVGFFDGKGHLHLTGRTKELIISNGEKIMPLELDNIILEQGELKPFIDDCVAFGMPHPLKHSVVWIAIVLKLKYKDDEGKKDFIRNHIGETFRQTVSKFKWPERIVFIADLPRTITGKVQRSQVAKLFLPKL